MPKQMGWIEQIADRFRNSSVLISSKSFVQDRCPIEFASIPDPSVVLDADALVNRVEEVENTVDQNPYCDVIALCEPDEHPTTIFVEAKTDRTHTNARVREAISQLSWSFEHFAGISAICPTLPISCRRFAVVTFTRVNDNVLRSPTVKERARAFRRQHGSRIFYVRAGQDIWQAIQSNST